jgi:hypothetical protein
VRTHGLTVNAILSAALVEGGILEYSNGDSSTWATVNTAHMYNITVSFVDSKLKNPLTIPSSALPIPSATEAALPVNTLSSKELVTHTIWDNNDNPLITDKNGSFNLNQPENSTAVSHFNANEAVDWSLSEEDGNVYARCTRQAELQVGVRLRRSEG